MITLKKISLFYIIAVVIAGVSVNTAYGQGQLVSSPTPTSLVVDSNTGKILYEKNSNIKIYPASLTKLMTLYLLFEAIDSGKLRMTQKLYVSKKAEKMLPLKLGLKSHETITVRDSISALIIKSANDVAVVVAENIKGSEEKFVGLMNYRARQLGMKSTHFANASGWHHPAQKTTARDLTKLALAIKRDFPKHYHIFAQNSFVFRGKVIKGHNKVNETYYGAEGLKTGYTTPAGYNVITAATRQKKSLMAIVTGCKSSALRNDQMVKLLDKHFESATSVMPSRSIVKVNTQPVKSSKTTTHAQKVKTTKVALNGKLKTKKKLARS